MMTANAVAVVVATAGGAGAVLKVLAVVIVVAAEVPLELDSSMLLAMLMDEVLSHSQKIVVDGLSEAQKQKLMNCRLPPRLCEKMTKGMGNPGREFSDLSQMTWQTRRAISSESRRRRKQEAARSKEWLCLSSVRYQLNLRCSGEKNLTSCTHHYYPYPCHY